MRCPSVSHCAKLIEGELSKMGVADDDPDYVFGEIVARGFMPMLHLTMQRWAGRLPSSRSFCDIGSGTGGAVAVACASGLFDTAIGIELIEPLHDAGLELVKTVRLFFLAVPTLFELADACCSSIARRSPRTAA